MSAAVWWVADPPQAARLQSAFAVNGASYNLNDRLQGTDAFSVLTMYKCTTPGVGPFSAFNPLGVSPYTFGTSVWTVYTPTGFANAATYLLTGRINYVDAEFQFLQLILTTVTATVYVDVNTMLPAVGRNPYSAYAFYFPSYPIFMGHYSAGGYHGRARFGLPATEGMAPVSVDTVGVGAVADMRGWRGVDVTDPTVGTFALTLTGIANKITVPNAVGVNPSFVTGLSDYAAAQRTFGVHVAHNLGASIMPTPSFSTAASVLYLTPVADISDAAFSPQPFVLGSQCGLAQTFTTYRNGANPPEDQPQSFLFSGQYNSFPGSHRVSPFLFVHNSLTGSRTLTLRFLTDTPWDNDITDLDIWLDCFYPSSNTTPQYSLATTENANWGLPAAVGSAIATDASTWTYSSIFFATSWKLVLTFSPQRAGMLYVRINTASPKLGRYVMFVCPFIEMH